MGLVARAFGPRSIQEESSQVYGLYTGFTYLTLRQIPPTEEAPAEAATPPTRKVPQTTFYCG